MPTLTAAAKLLLVSLPIALSLPRVVPYFPVPNTTTIGPLTTGVPGLASVLHPTISYDTGPEVFAHTLSLHDEPIPIPDPTTTVSLDHTFGDPVPKPLFHVHPLNTLVSETPSVSIKTFLSILQPLLDLIRDSISTLPETPGALSAPSSSDAEPGAPILPLGKRDSPSIADSNALSKFYTCLVANQEPIENPDLIAATLKNSFDALDDASKAALLSALAPGPVRGEVFNRRDAVGQGNTNHDEGPELDDAEKLGPKLDAVLGAKDSLDPLGQNDQHEGDRYDAKKYWTDDDAYVGDALYDDTFSPDPGHDDSSRSQDDDDVFASQDDPESALIYSTSNGSLNEGSWAKFNTLDDDSLDTAE